ncbi:MAG: 2'-deoxycytidine 5'-triphosphate deaminase [Hyphomonadaceae bacterium]|nr:2'-deoxycytidine 5'-triphosphate deaminase [Hyphomonadaceae bacterium]
MPDSNPSPGVLPDTQLTVLAEAGAIRATAPLAPGQIQPASLDLRIGNRALRIRASVLPGAGRTVEQRLAAPDLGVMHEIDLSAGAVLETGCVYMVPLMERLALPSGISGVTNPKSSTGRIDVFVRVITDGAQAFDRVPDGYQGPLWAEISPRTFPIRIKAGERLTQLRLKRGAPRGQQALDLALDLDPASIGPIAGWRARRHAPLLDLSAIGAHEARHWFEPIPAEGGTLILDPGEFYILASQANVTIGPDVAAEMVATAEDLGEFRAHYAGFFDPGFGHPAPARAVLEVRGRDVPFVLEHGQKVARLVYEPLAATPSWLYGAPSGAGASHYQGQGLKLSKLFA